MPTYIVNYVSGLSDLVVEAENKAEAIEKAIASIKSYIDGSDETEWDVEEDE